MHTLSVAGADYLELEKKIDHPVVTPIFAGLVTGGIYKSTKGPRAAALAAVIGAGASVAYWFGSNFVSDVLLRRKGRF